MSLENILSRDCSSFSRDDLESSSMRRRRPCCGCPGRSRVKAGAGGSGRVAEGGGRAEGAAALIGERGAAAGGSEDVRLQSGLRGARRQRRRGHGGRSSGSSGCCARRGLQGAPVPSRQAQASAAGGAGRGAGRAGGEGGADGGGGPRERAGPAAPGGARTGFSVTSSSVPIWQRRVDVALAYGT